MHNAHEFLSMYRNFLAVIEWSIHSLCAQRLAIINISFVTYVIWLFLLWLLIQSRNDLFQLDQAPLYQPCLHVNDESLFSTFWRRVIMCLIVTWICSDCCSVFVGWVSIDQHPKRVLNLRSINGRDFRQNALGNVNTTVYNNSLYLQSNRTVTQHSPLHALWDQILLRQRHRCDYQCLPNNQSIRHFHLLGSLSKTKLN